MLINGDLTQEHQLDNTTEEKPILDAGDFAKVLQCYWVMEMSVFSYER